MVAEFARQLIWEHSFLQPKDSIHVATALKTDVEALHTFDNDMIRLSGLIGHPPLQICTPNIEGQMALDLPAQQ